MADEHNNRSIADTELYATRVGEPLFMIFMVWLLINSFIIGPLALVFLQAHAGLRELISPKIRHECGRCW